ncbi:hypothetical protein ONS96_007625 [Cadophora gregata f. sp. sojae]|nr:hypothetical protein ONS96_007625 [Cadophora gregata f. sp. sojae]
MSNIQFTMTPKQRREIGYWDDENFTCYVERCTNKTGIQGAACKEHSDERAQTYPNDRTGFSYDLCLPGGETLEGRNPPYAPPSGTIPDTKPTEYHTPAPRK